MSRPQTANSWRSSNSAYGAGLRPKSAYSGVKSRVYTPKAARPATAPGGKAARRSNDGAGTCTASRFLHHNGDKFAVMHPHKVINDPLPSLHISHQGPHSTLFTKGVPFCRDLRVLRVVILSVNTTNQQLYLLF